AAKPTPILKNSLLRMTARLLPCPRSSAVGIPRCERLLEQKRKSIRHVRARPIDFALPHEARLPTKVEHNAGRQPFDVPELGDGTVAVKQNREGRPRTEEAANGAIGFSDADDHDLEGLAGEACTQFLQSRHFRAARLAPGGEKVDEDNAAAVIREPTARSIEARELKQRLGAGAEANEGGGGIRLPLRCPTRALFADHPQPDDQQTAAEPGAHPH